MNTKTKILSVLLGLSMLAMPLFTGCRTPQQMDQMVDIITTLADTTMETYVQVALSKPDVTPERRAKVTQQYEAYKASMLAAKAAYAAYASDTTQRPAFLKALQALDENRTALVELILALQSK